MIKWLINLFRRKYKMPDGSWDFFSEKIYDTDAIYEDIFGSIDFGGKASKDWRPYAPKLEIQSFGDCVSFSRTSCAEIKAKYKGAKDPDGDDWNFSDVDLAVGSGTSLKGNSLRRVAEYARKTGVSLEKDIPYIRNWSKRLALYNAGKKFTKYKLGNWSWVKPNVNSLKSALDDSPLQIGIGVGSNWRIGKIIKDLLNYLFYHAIVLLHIDEEGVYHIYDSYRPKYKTLDPKYNILFAMSFRDLPSGWRGINTDGERLHKRLIGKYILRSEANGELYFVSKDRISYITISISNKDLTEQFHKFLRLNKKFLGISEKDFKKLKETIIVSGGTLDEKVD